MRLLPVYARGGGTDQCRRSRFGENKGAPRSLAAPVVPHDADRYITLPPLEVHSPALAASVQPWPLQAFWPLQAELAVLQALWPLQALTPPHLAVWAWAAVASVPAAKRAAASMRS